MSDNTKPQGPYTVKTEGDNLKRHTVHGPDITCYFMKLEDAYTMQCRLNAAWLAGRASVDGKREDNTSHSS